MASVQFTTPKRTQKATLIADVSTRIGNARNVSKASTSIKI